MSRARVTATHRGRTQHDVTVVDIDDTDTDDYLTTLAMTATRETRGSLFGARVTRYPGGTSATVVLYTD